MFQGITVARNRPEERGRRQLQLDKTLLAVDWRFLAVADDEPGFLTAWLQPRSLEQHIDRREEECFNGVLAGFAKEIGVDGVFATTHTTRVSQGEIAHNHVGPGEIAQNHAIQGGIAQNHVIQGEIDQNHARQGGIDQNRARQGGIKTLENGNEGGGRENIERVENDNNDRGEHEDIEHAGRDSVASLNESDGPSSHHAHPEPPQMAQTYSLDGRPRKGRNSLVAALKKGGVHFPLAGGDTSHSEDAGEWDGVDLASAPCLQSHVARNAADARRMARHPSTCTGGGGVGQTVDRTTTCADAGGRKLSDRRDAAPVPTRPSEPPALMVFKPCLSVKLAENVPGELQTMIQVPEPRRSRLGRHLLKGSGASQPQQPAAGGQSLQDRAVEKLKIDLSLKQISPTCPQGPRPSKEGRRKRSADASKEVPCKPRFRHTIPPEPTFRASSYGKAWYVDPDLWGVGISPEARKADLGQLDQYAKGLKQQLTHAEAIKATIPTLFSATRFVSYIRQKGLRMPAHLERTERAMEEAKMRAMKARQFRNAGQDPAELVEDENNDDENQQEWDNDGNNMANDEANPKMKWQSKLDMAMRLIRQRERRTLLGTQPTPPGRGGKAR